MARTKQVNNQIDVGIDGIRFEKVLSSQESKTEPNISLSEEKDKLEHDRFSQDTKYRSLFSDWVIIYISLYTIFVIFILVGVGHRWLTIESSVLVTLLGTTTANILGLAYIILHGLFDKDKKGHG